MKHSEIADSAKTMENEHQENYRGIRIKSLTNSRNKLFAALIMSLLVLTLSWHDGVAKVGRSVRNGCTVLSDN